VHESSKTDGNFNQSSQIQMDGEAGGLRATDWQARAA